MLRAGRSMRRDGAEGTEEMGIRGMLGPQLWAGGLWEALCMIPKTNRSVGAEEDSFRFQKTEDALGPAQYADT